MTGRSLVAVAFLAAAGCAPVRVDTRVDRGPVLRTFERQGSSSPGGVLAQAAVEWPRAAVSFRRFDLCRTERVEQFEEERVTERSVPGAGASVALGTTAALVGAGLLLALPAFSAEPDTHLIDAEGRYGPAPRQVALGWGAALVAAGVPSLGIGVWGLARQGEQTERRPVEQVVSVDEQRCNLRPVAGAVALTTTRAALPPSPLKEGELPLLAKDFATAELISAEVDGEEAVFAPEAWELLREFQACARAGPPETAAERTGLELLELKRRLDLARSCVDLPGAEGPRRVRELEGELERRLGVPRVPQLTGPQDALAAYPPVAAFKAGSKDLDRLAHPELRGKVVQVQGVLARWLDPEIAVLDLGGRVVWLVMAGAADYLPGVPDGATIEVLAIHGGMLQIGDVDAPLLRAKWGRVAP